MEEIKKNPIADEELKDASGGGLGLAFQCLTFKLVCENEQCGFEIQGKNDIRNEVHKCIVGGLSSYTCPKCKRKMYLRNK